MEVFERCRDGVISSSQFLGPNEKVHGPTSLCHLLRRAAHPEGTSSLCSLWYFVVHTLLLWVLYSSLSL